MAREVKSAQARREGDRFMVFAFCLQSGVAFPGPQSASPRRRRRNAFDVADGLTIQETSQRGDQGLPVGEEEGLVRESAGLLDEIRDLDKGHGLAEFLARLFNPHGVDGINRDAEFVQTKDLRGERAGQRPGVAGSDEGKSGASIR